jgi:hypothetical protein
MDARTNTLPPPAGTSPQENGNGVPALDFGDIAPKEITIRMGNRLYIIREASSDAAVKFRNASLKAAKMVDGKLSGMDGLADAEPLLVSLCVFEADTRGIISRDSQGHPIPVTLQTVRGWPNRVQKLCFDKIKEISDGLDEKDTVQSLQKKIVELEKRRKELMAAETPEEEVKNS